MKNKPWHKMLKQIDNFIGIKPAIGVIVFLLIETCLLAYYKELRFQRDLTFSVIAMFYCLILFDDS